MDASLVRALKAARDTLDELETTIERQEEKIEELEGENTRLTERVAELEQELAAQEA